MVSRDRRQLIEQYVEAEPQRGPAEARLVDSSVPVWIVVDHCRLAGRDVDRVAADYDLPHDAVEAALAFFALHEPAIEARIDAHHAAFAA